MIIKKILIGIVILFISIFSFSMEKNELNSKKKLSIELINAVKNNEINKVKELLNLEIDINFENENEITPLMKAVYYHNIEIVKLLISAGANLNLRNWENRTALIKALDFTNLDIAELLIEAGADISLQDDRGDTALHWALGKAGFCGDISNKCLEITKLLIDKGANVNLRNNKGETPLRMCVYYFEDENLLKFFIEKSERDTISDALCYICFKNYKKKAIELLLEANPDLNYKNNRQETPLDALYNSGYARNCEIIEMLIQSGADLNLKNENGNTLLLNACLNYREMDVYDWNYIFMKKLIYNNADLSCKNNKEQTVMMILKEKNKAYPNDQKILELLKWITKKYEGYKNKVYKAIEKSNLEEFKEYIFKIGSICFKDNDGNNLLYYAIKYKNMYFIKLLWYLKPDFIAQENILNQTPLDLAKDLGFFDIILAFNI